MFSGEGLVSWNARGCGGRFVVESWTRRLATLSLLSRLSVDTGTRWRERCKESIVLRKQAHRVRETRQDSTEKKELRREGTMTAVEKTSRLKSFDYGAEGCFLPELPLVLVNDVRGVEE